MENIKQQTAIERMDEILVKKREQGLQGMRIFVADDPNVTAEQIAEAYCKMEEAEYTDVTDKIL